MDLNPKYYRLSPRIQLEKLGVDHIAIVKRIKSRIIQKDAWKIVEMVEKIKTVENNYTVSLVCNNNICSKSLKVLAENDIDVRIVYKA